MKAPIDPKLRNAGSSTLLVILVIVSFCVVVGLMIKSSSKFSKAANGEREVGKQEGAVESTFDVFETYDSIMDGAAGDSAPVDAAPKKAAPSGAGLPMHLTDRPPAKEFVPKAASPTAVPTKAEGDAPAAAGSTGALNSANDGLEALTPDGTIWPHPGGENSESRLAEGALPLPSARDAAGNASVVEHILPDSGITPISGMRRISWMSVSDSICPPCTRSGL